MNLFVQGSSKTTNTLDKLGASLALAYWIITTLKNLTTHFY